MKNLVFAIALICLFSPTESIYSQDLVPFFNIHQNVSLTTDPSAQKRLAQTRFLISPHQLTANPTTEGEVLILKVNVFGEVIDEITTKNFAMESSHSKDTWRFRFLIHYEGSEIEIEGQKTQNETMLRATKPWDEILFIELSPVAERILDRGFQFQNDPKFWLSPDILLRHSDGIEFELPKDYGWNEFYLKGLEIGSHEADTWLTKVFPKIYGLLYKQIAHLESDPSSATVRSEFPRLSFSFRDGNDFFRFNELVHLLKARNLIRPSSFDTSDLENAGFSESRYYFDDDQLSHTFPPELKIILLTEENWLQRGLGKNAYAHIRMNVGDSTEIYIRTFRSETGEKLVLKRALYWIKWNLVEARLFEALQIRKTLRANRQQLIDYFKLEAQLPAPLTSQAASEALLIYAGQYPDLRYALQTSRGHCADILRGLGHQDHDGIRAAGFYPKL